MRQVIREDENIGVKRNKREWRMRLLRSGGGRR
jgi:hypothetical protein